MVPEQTLQYSVILSFRLADQHAAGQGSKHPPQRKRPGPVALLPGLRWRKYSTTMHLNDS